MPDTKFRNTLLQHLEAATIARLRLMPITLDVRQSLEVPGEAIRNTVFMEEGIGSMTTIFRDGFEVEVGMFGYESAVGISALMGTRHSLNGVFMQLGGWGYSSPVQAAKEEFDRNGDFHFLALRYVQAQLTQGLIAYNRGTIEILDREGLMKQACECYQVVKSHLDDFAEFDTGFAV